MTSFERTYNGRVMRAIKRLIDLGRSEPIIPEPELLVAYDHKPGQAKWTAIWLSVVFFLCLLASCNHAFASEITPKKCHITQIKAIQAIVGEAENQGYKGMLAVACALRNRGTLKGVYGYRNVQKRWTKLSSKIKQIAEIAWVNSDKNDVTNGATHWENIRAFGKPCWVSRCIETFRYKDHVFYREIV